MEMIYMNIRTLSARNEKLLKEIKEEEEEKENIPCYIEFPDIN